jgi:hypothetical protein
LFNGKIQNEGCAEIGEKEERRSQEHAEELDANST